MSNIIKIHNSNNEQAWQEILKWEAMHARYPLLAWATQAPDTLDLPLSPPGPADSVPVVPR